MRVPFTTAVVLSLLFWGMEPLLGQQAPAEKAPPAAKSSYAYPTEALKKMYEEHVGMEKGDGPFADAYKPIPLHMYLNPCTAQEK